MNWTPIIAIAVSAAAGLVGDVISMAQKAGAEVDVPAVLAQLTAQIQARAGQVASTEAAVADILDDRKG